MIAKKEPIFVKRFVCVQVLCQQECRLAQ